MSSDVKSAKVEPTIRADLTLTKDDIINIRISEIEEAALAEISAKQGANDKLRERIGELLKKAQAVIEKYVKDTYADYGSDLEAVLGKYFKVKRQLSFNLSNNETGTKLNVGIRLYLNDAAARHHQEDVNLFVEDKIPQDSLDLNAQVKELEKEIEANNEVIFNEKRKIAQLAITERRARAALSRALLGGQGGQAILAALGSVGANVPLLGNK